MSNAILLIRLRLLGDILFTIPALQILKQSRPGCRLLYVMEEPFRDLRDLIPFVDEWIIVPRKMSIPAVIAFGNRIRRDGIDRVIDFHSGPKSAWMTLSTFAKMRVGYRSINRNLAYTDIVERPAAGRYVHSVQNQVKLLEPLGISAEAPPFYPSLNIAPSWRTVEIDSFHARPGKKAVIHIGAGNEFRDWGFERFRALIQLLKNDTVSVALIGHNQWERERARRIASELDVCDFTGKLTFPGMAALITGADAYFGADSGPLHLASLTSTPIVGLYGPNVPQVSGPWRPDHTILLQKEKECRPCSQRKCLYGTMECLREISVQEAYEAINEFF